jgi:hypothetical protein
MAFSPPLWEPAMKSDKDAEAVELSVKELEERIAPVVFQ